MLEVNEESMLRFIKLLIEMSGAYQVQDDRTVLTAVTKAPVAVEIAGKKELPLKIFKEGDPNGGYVYLQPFKETSVSTTARSWFYRTCAASLAILLKNLIIKAVDLAAHKTSTNTDQLPILSKILDNADEQMISEVEKLQLADLIQLYYNKKTKTAMLNAYHMAPETREKYPKFRKKTWEVIETLMEIFLSEEDLEPEGIISYTASLLNIPETEAKLQVIVSTAMRMEPFTKLFLDRDLQADELKDHLKLLAGYNKLHIYLNADISMPAQQQQVPVQNPFGVANTGFIASQPTVKYKEVKPNAPPPVIPKTTLDDVPQLTPIGQISNGTGVMSNPSQQFMPIQQQAPQIIQPTYNGTGAPWPGSQQFGYQPQIQSAYAQQPQMQPQYGGYQQPMYPQTNFGGLGPQYPIQQPQQQSVYSAFGGGGNSVYSRPIG